MKSKILPVTIILAAFFSTAFAQTPNEAAIKKIRDSLTLEGLSAYAVRYPQLRQGSVAVDLIGNTNVKGGLNGRDLYEGKMNITRIRSVFNVPVSHWGKNMVTATVGYQQHRLQTTEIKSFSPTFPTTDIDVTKRTVSLTANFSRSDSIFNHPVFYSVGVSGITDEFSSIKRVNYLGVITVPLKRTQYSSLSVGVVVILDPSAVTPVITVVSYWHKYKNSALELFVDIPSRIALRKQLSKRSWASVGTELGGSLQFFELNQPSLPQHSIYSYAELRSGATFEYQATKKLILGINGGMFNTFSTRMFDRNDKPKDYFYKGSNGTSPYVSFSLSFLPFLKR
jgi:hypothetical protein